MTGPYTAHIYLNTDPYRASGEADFTLTWEENLSELKAGDAIAMRFYRSGGGGTLLGTLRAAVFAVAQLLEPGEQAYVRLVGRHGGVPQTADGAEVRRDAAGRLITTLGSRWSRERVFAGV